MTDSWIGGHNIQIGVVGGDISILLDRPSFRLELLRPMESPELPAKVRHQPSYLLDPSHQVVPYRPSVSLEMLASWRDNKDDLSVLLLHGPGGQGKTRTAQHFAACAASDGWSVAQARDLATAAPVLPPVKEPFAERLLIIVDYAERWRFPSLLTMLELIRSDGQARIVRILLLARSDTHLWDQLEAELDSLGIGYAQPIALPGFSGPSREALFTEASAAFAHALDAPELSPPVPDNLADPAYASPLTLHMAALAGVVAAREGDSRPTDISRYLLLHERRRWNDPATGDTVRALVALATLFGPAPTRESARALLLAAGAADGPAEADRALKAHRTLYPSDRHLAPLRPDRFAEDFLGWYLSRDQDAGEDLAALLTGDGTALQDGDIRQALIVLANAARHEPVRDLLDKVITQRHDLAETSPAIMLAVAEHLPISTVLGFAVCPDKSAELAYARVRIAQRFAEARPDGAPALLDIINLRLLGNALLDCGEYAQAANALGKAIRQVRVHRDDPEIGYPVALADLLNAYSAPLLYGGRPHEAVGATAEAIELLRDQLPEISAGDVSVHKDSLARSLINHANALAQIEELPNALDAAKGAVVLYKELASENFNGYGAALFRAQTRVGNLLSQAGQHEDAFWREQSAANTLRRLYARSPEEHREDYANTLYNLGVTLDEMGLAEQAAPILSEAADLFRYLAQHVPLRFLDRLANCLFLLSSALEELGRVGERIRVLREVVIVTRQLREKEPDRYDTRLALTLFFLGQELATREDFEDASPALTEAKELFQSLVMLQPEPAEVLPDVLVTLSFVQAALDDLVAATATAREGIAMLRKHSENSGEAVPRGGFAVNGLKHLVPLLAEMGGEEQAAVLAELDELLRLSAPDASR
ncbi:tetratricopeptide repeat protein [Streptomyces auratus]|uniref:Tetratricopeptide repeat protein n=1 Tax=Streptomyces auratus AGR0001 TaxID=1160718 RepID=J1ZZ54_9ACTN|nr:tetratricopeptide repeat protein [Streptomyces auratus]QTZ93795.1 tetratricopeptide repeat protein [Streptomyces auratus AGR0001]